MALKLVVKSLDEVEEALRPLYRKDGEEFVLDTDDTALKEARDKVREFRDTNTTLMRSQQDLKERLDRFKDLDPELARQAMDAFKHLEKLEDAELLKAGKIDEVVARRTRRLHEDHEKALAAKDKELKKLTEQITTSKRRIQDYTIRDEVLRAVKSAGELRPEAELDVILRAQQTFRLTDDGKLAAYEGDNARVNNKGDAYTPDDFAAELITSAPYLFNGSGGSGGKGSESGVKRGPDGKIRLSASDPVGLGRHADAIAKGEAIIVD